MSTSVRQRRLAEIVTRPVASKKSFAFITPAAFHFHCQPSIAVIAVGLRQQTTADGEEHERLLSLYHAVEENMLFLDDAAGAGRARGSLETAGAALTQHTRPVLKS